MGWIKHGDASQMEGARQGGRRRAGSGVARAPPRGPRWASDTAEIAGLVSGWFGEVFKLLEGRESAELGNCRAGGVMVWLVTAVAERFIRHWQRVRHGCQGLQWPTAAPHGLTRMGLAAEKKKKRQGVCRGRERLHRCRKLRSTPTEGPSWSSEVLVADGGALPSPDWVWHTLASPDWPSVVVRRLFRNASLVGYPRFFVSQARVFVVLGVLSRYLCRTVEVCVVFLDTLTPEFELYVRLRERRQWGSDFPEFVLLSLSPQLFDFFLVERQLDLSSVTARLRGSEMADKRDWGGGGDESEESTHQLIERLWESIKEIRTRLDQQPSVQPAVTVPSVEEEAVPLPLVPPPGLEVSHVVPLPPVVLMRPASMEESTILVERFLRLQPPTYAPYVVTNNAMMVEYFIRGLRPELQDAMISLICGTVEEAAQRAAIFERTM
ncbi:hypothetical protein Taro_001686 [Colocasia esculenta]|uniref:Uncharacterized protein n=1 Tax=Colocasia esculenta TaxID=4460 RepID=A0A843TED1_COLES|nr:hypothetical protein [Colocasia esculenta]